MNIERVKYVIWAADMDRAIRFYRDTCGGRLLKQNSVIAEVEILGSVIGIHSGGEGKRTWTGLSFQVPDVIAGAECVDVVTKAGAYVGKLRGERGFSAAEVFGIGELHVSSLAGDCVNGMPGPLHGGGVVGKIHHARSACALMGVAD